MANYTTAASDKSKSKAIRLLISGFIGLHLFYVGKIKKGVVRLLEGLLSWIVLISGIVAGEIKVCLLGIVLLLAFNLPDLFKLLLGTFQDNVGNYLRCK